jgi:hypothetical protein
MAQNKDEVIARLSGELMFVKGKLSHYQDIRVPQLEREVEYLNKKLKEKTND